MSQLPGAARYVAIIIDGNGRWAQARGLSVSDGHRAGADTLRARLHDAIDLDIRQLTVFSLSTENWSRPQVEIQALVSLFHQRITDETAAMHAQGVSVRFIGRREGLAPLLVRQMQLTEELTRENRGITLFIAFNYGGRAEIIDAARRSSGNSEAEFQSCLYAPDLHDPELIIRTGGERRLSNFLLWQSADAELVVRNELWPDFGRDCLEQSLQEFHQRNRQRQQPGRDSDCAQLL
jgi:undecaprenyl diphosphate synthase